MSITEEEQQLMEGLKLRSGTVTLPGRLTSFLYELMRDVATPGVIEGLMTRLPKKGENVVFTNGWLASYAEDVAKRILE